MPMTRDQNWEVRKAARMCVCLRQPQITPRDIDHLARAPEDQLRNLPETYREQLYGLSPYDARELFQNSHVPFRYQGCPRNMLRCCGCCTRVCNKRCPQDVLNRAYLACAFVLENPTPENLQRAELPVRMLYAELTSETPRYFAIAAMVTELLSPHLNKQLERTMEEVYGNEDNPYKFDYAAAIEYEEYVHKRPDGLEEIRLRKKADPETGNVSVLYWPRSGMCPYCLPTGLVVAPRTKRSKKYL